VRALALPRRDWPLVAGGAVLLLFAYPPFHLIIPSFVALVPAVLLIADAEADRRPLRRRLVQGFWFGFLANGLILYWMVVALWHFTPAIAAGYLATVIVLALYTAGVFALAGWTTRATGVSVLIALPVFWTAMDWLIGHQGDIRFPWLGLGTSLTGYPVLVQIAEVVGARGVTFLLVLANAALALAWLERRDPRRAWFNMGWVVTGVLLSGAFGLWRQSSIPLRTLGTVAVIQPNIGFDEKWADQSGELIFAKTLAQADSMIQAGRPDLVVWPEAAVPGYLRQRSEWAERIAALSRAARASQLVGALDFAPNPASDGYRIYNSAFLFDSLGRWDVHPVYHKQYLVPITEKVPFVPSKWFDLPFFGSFAEGGPGPVYEAGIGRFGVIICYESIFENLSRDYRRRGADFLVNITNDAWFGRTAATYQHAAHLVMRAIENRVGIARAANTGISEFVDPLGRQSARTGLYVEAAASRPLVTAGVLTLYTRLGDWVGLTALLGGAVLSAFAWWRSR
jgi:apolipoprotein N-acyltransferase